MTRHSSSHRCLSKILQAAGRQSIKRKEYHPILSTNESHVGDDETGRNPSKFQGKTNSDFLPLKYFSLEAEHLGFCNATSSPNTPIQLKPTLSNPSEFHSKLCKLIRNSKHRVIIASLYIGTGGCTEKYPKENELLEAIQYASSESIFSPQISVLLDANRSLRPVRRKRKVNQAENKNKINSDEDIISSSAEALHQCLNGSYSSSHPENTNKLCLFNVLNFPKSMLPNPINEVAGVFHMKAYIIDDNLILSGANLSEEYFTNRQDRYMHFTNGGGGIVDFYADLVNILCQHSTPYTGNLNWNKKNINRLDDVKSKRELIESLSILFDGSTENVHNCNADQSSRKNENKNKISSKNIIAYAIPTLQLPKSFQAAPLPCVSDVNLLTDLLQTLTHEIKEQLSIRLSSAYLNPTPTLINALQRFSSNKRNGKEKNKDMHQIFLLSAGQMSHGFAPKKNQKQMEIQQKQNNSYYGLFMENAKSWIPRAFAALSNEVATQMYGHNGKLLFYERPNWTFHTKGLWISKYVGQSSDKSVFNEKKKKKKETLMTEDDHLLLTVVGSGNYGARSENLDLESNCVLILNNNDECNFETREAETQVRSSITQEWNAMCQYAKSHVQDKADDNAKQENIVFRMILPLVRKYL